MLLVDTGNEATVNLSDAGDRYRRPRRDPHRARLVFGRLPEIGRPLGKGMCEFREQACCIDQLVMPSRLLGPAPSLE
jgi:hypothetical protein